MQNAPPLAASDSHSPPATGEPGPEKIPGVIIDRSLNIVEFLGHTGPYLDLPPGTPHLNLRRMARPGLGVVLVKAIQEAKKQKARVRKQGVRFSHEGAVKTVDVTVSLVENQPQVHPLILVRFHEVPSRAPAAGKPGETRSPQPATPRRAAAQSAVARLKENLDTTQQYLESIFAEHEANLQKLKAAYAERETTNRELENANAEIEAFNAELAAANDELETTNCRLQHANQRLATAIRERDRAEQERKRLQEKQHEEKQLKSLRVLVAGVAHDFNNLLVGILGNAALGLEEAPPGSPLRPFLEQIERAGERAADLTRQMMVYAGSSRSVIGHLDLSSLASETTDLLRSSLSKTAALECHFAKSLPSIAADATQIRQVMMNLITNASEALEEKPGVIRITTGVMHVSEDYLAGVQVGQDLPPGEYVYLKVSDSGGGLDDQTRAKIFDPFFTTKFAGRGLGLAAVLGIVQGHSGAIRVDSRPGQGTTFRVLFPPCRETSAKLPSDSPRTSRQPPSPDQWRGKGTVLVVDDESQARDLAKAVLERSGLDILTAADGREALRVFADRSQDVEAVLLDLAMPGMDGLEVSSKLRLIRQDVPVILCSGFDEETIQERCATQGFADFLRKPYLPRQLVEKVRRLLVA